MLTTFLYNALGKKVNLFQCFPIRCLNAAEYPRIRQVARDPRGSFFIVLLNLPRLYGNTSMMLLLTVGSGDDTLEHDVCGLFDCELGAFNEV